ncbi:hypothetical protein [Actinokineospora sp. NBRC 105648]|uniref:hypothetical protein n=1 Tax=Actinokineospora sp. NBRC 105648 TaxID=3032206 RepID=UPI0024A291B3|nr:hypothetical protein [Actinokineospora sp. NBRC 105648]GLZ39476.1 hypothetical protein Acsp05_31000 [Actinokineospora sp. NBRC 105648]
MTAIYAPVPVGYPRPPRQPVWWTGLLSAIGFLAAAALAVTGSFLPVFRLTFPGPDEELVVIEQTLWSASTTDRTSVSDFLRSHSDLSGIPVAVGAGLLAVAAVLGLLAALRRSPGLVTGLRVSGAVGLGVLAGGVAEVALNVFTYADTALKSGIFGDEMTATAQLGLFLVMGGVGLALVAAVLSWLRRPSGRVEPATPPMGFRMPGNFAPQVAHPGGQPSGPYGGQAVPGQQGLAVPGQQGGQIVPGPHGNQPGPYGNQVAPGPQGGFPAATTGGHPVRQPGAGRPVQPVQAVPPVQAGAGQAAPDSPFGSDAEVTQAVSPRVVAQPAAQPDPGETQVVSPHTPPTTAAAQAITTGTPDAPAAGTEVAGVAQPDPALPQFTSPHPISGALSSGFEPDVPADTTVTTVVSTPKPPADNASETETPAADAPTEDTAPAADDKAAPEPTPSDQAPADAAPLAAAPLDSAPADAAQLDEPAAKKAPVEEK